MADPKMPRTAKAASRRGSAARPPAEGGHEASTADRPEAGQDDVASNAPKRTSKRAQPARQAGAAVKRAPKTETPKRATRAAPASKPSTPRARRTGGTRRGSVKQEETPAPLRLGMQRMAVWWQRQHDRLRMLRGPEWKPAHRTVPGPRLLPLAGALLGRGRQRHAERNATAPRGDADKGRTGHRPWVWWLLALGLLLLGICGAVALYLFRAQPEPQPPAPQAPYVETVPARAGNAPIIVTGNGTVSPRAEVAVTAQVGGQVVEVSPDLQSGASVREGEVLFRLNPADYQNQVDQARAEVARREVELEQARQERAIAEEEYRRLRDRLGEPVPGLDETTDFDVAGRRDPGALGGAGGQGGAGAANPLALRQPQLDAAEATLQAARAQLADAELALQRTVVTAPFNGRVRSEDVALGQYIQPGQEVARLYSDDVAEVAVPLSDSRAALIPGLWDADDSRATDAQVIIEYGGRRYGWSGHVDRARGAIDPRSRTVDVVVRVPDPFRPGIALDDGGGADRPPRQDASPPLLIGAYATVRIEGQAPQRYLEVPTDALRSGDTLWVLGKAEREGRSRLMIVPVGIIQRNDRTSYVTADLPDGALIVTNTLQTVTDGMLVRTRVEQGGNTASPEDLQQSSGNGGSSGNEGGGGAESR